MKIGITGGIGSGKSYVAQLLRQRDICVYDCDSAAKRLMNNSPELKAKLKTLIGSQAYDLNGRLNKAEVAQFLLASETNRKTIDNIVHPAVFSDFKQSGMTWIESAILFESGLDRLVDRIVLVSAPDDIRISRIMLRDGISREKACDWIGQQWPTEELRKRSHFEIVNDGKSDLNSQIDDIIRQTGSRPCQA